MKRISGTKKTNFGLEFKGKIINGKKKKTPQKSPKKRKITGLIGENTGGTY